MRVPLIDNFRFDKAWDPEKVTPSEDKGIIGFRVQLDSTDLTPVPPKPFELVQNHIGTAPSSPESEDEFLAAWPSTSPSVPSY